MDLTWRIDTASAHAPDVYSRWFHAPGRSRVGGQSVDVEGFQSILLDQLIEDR